MRNGLTLLLIGAGQGVPAAFYPHLAWLLLWSGLGFCTVGVAYILQKPLVFGKKPDGTMAWGRCALLLPYLLLTWLLWECQTRLSREAACQEIVPGLWLGRRVTAAELPCAMTLIVDLTSEFSEPIGLRDDGSYLCLPTLDQAVPDRQQFEAAVERIAAWQGPTYVHCALGHGRSALVVAAVLRARGLANTPEEALARVRQKRPGVKLSREQWEYLCHSA